MEEGHLYKAGEWGLSLAAPEGQQELAACAATAPSWQLFNAAGTSAGLQTGRLA